MWHLPIKNGCDFFVREEFFYCLLEFFWCEFFWRNWIGIQIQKSLFFFYFENIIRIRLKSIIFVIFFCVECWSNVNFDSLIYFTVFGTIFSWCFIEWNTFQSHSSKVSLESSNLNHFHWNIFVYYEFFALYFFFSKKSVFLYYVFFFCFVLICNLFNAFYHNIRKLFGKINVNFKVQQNVYDYGKKLFLFDACFLCLWESLFFALKTEKCPMCERKKKRRTAKKNCARCPHERIYQY